MEKKTNEEIESTDAASNPLYQGTRGVATNPLYQGTRGVEQPNNEEQTDADAAKNEGESE